MKARGALVALGSLALSAALTTPEAALAAPKVPELIAAIKAGQRDAAAALLAEQTDVDVRATEPDGTTALHWAAQQNDVELAAELIEAGADPIAANRYGVTPLYLSAQNGNAALIALLLEAGADANATSTLGETALMTAARTGNVEAAEVLLAHGAEADAREEWHGQTALMWAAAEHHVEMIKALIAAGADVNAISNVEEWERQTTAEPRAKWLPPGGMTPLLFAAREGCAACVPVLVEAGADVDATTPDGISAVLSALINGHYDTAAALLEAGTDPNLVDVDGRGALYAAADFNTMPSSNRPAPYVLDSEHSALDIAKMLLARGADPNAALTAQAAYRAKLDRGNDTVLGAGTTPLMRAAKAGDLELMTVLLEHGADPLAATGRGVNSLMLAAGLGTAEQDTTGRHKTEAQAIAAIEMLLERDVDINATDGRGRTALHGAALQGYDDVVAMLVENGANLEATDREGFTPLDTALGLAGGWGFAGDVGVVQHSTVELIKKLLAERASNGAASASL